MSDTTDPVFWSKYRKKRKGTSFLKMKSFLRPTSGQKSGILERGFWPGDFGGVDGLGLTFSLLKPGFLKRINLRTPRGGPSTVPMANQGKNFWNLYNFAQQSQYFGEVGRFHDTPKWFQRPGFIDRGSDYERPGFIQSFLN